MLLTREQLQERLVALHQASLELVKDVSPERLPGGSAPQPMGSRRLATQQWGF